jgi:drug/metabolite transporter (DMT)-like permease
MLRATLLMIAAMSLIPLGDAAGKLLTSDHAAAPVFVGWSRFALGALLLLPFVQRRHWDARAFVDPRTIFRGLLIVGGIVSILTALRTEPLPNVFGAFFVGPILSFALSAVLLGERVRTVQAVLLALGFGGVLLVVRPGFRRGDGAWLSGVRRRAGTPDLGGARDSRGIRLRLARRAAVGRLSRRIPGLICVAQEEDAAWPGSTGFPD